MDKGLHLEISAERRAEVDAMSKNQLRYEIEKRKKSKLSRLLPYLERRLAEIEKEENPDEPVEEIAHESKADDGSVVTNVISDKVVRLSKWAIAISVIALLASVFASAIAAYVLFRI